MDRSSASTESNDSGIDIISGNGAHKKESSGLSQEEAAIEAKIIEYVRNGQWQGLRPNSGVSVEIRGSHLCVNYHDEVGYRVWEWHGHCMIYADGLGYTPEYIYGNYFEALAEEEEVSRPVGLGLLTPNNRRIVPGIGGMLGPINRQGAIPMRDILNEAYRRASK